MSKCTYVLFGVADRDEDELVCQFFPDEMEMAGFVNDLPGRYDTMRLVGVELDDITGVEHVWAVDNVIPMQERKQ